MKRLISFALAAVMVICSMLLSVSASNVNIATKGAGFNDNNKEEYYTGDGAKHDASCLNDGDKTTGWQYNKTSGSESEIVQFGHEIFAGIIFTEPQTVDHVKVYWEAASRADTSLDGYEIKYTIDPKGTTWRKLSGINYEYSKPKKITSTDETGVEKEIVEAETLVDDISFDEVLVYGISVFIYKATAKWSPKIYEIEIFKADSALTSEEKNPQTEIHIPSAISSTVSEYDPFAEFEASMPNQQTVNNLTNDAAFNGEKKETNNLWIVFSLIGFVLAAGAVTVYVLYGKKNI